MRDLTTALAQHSLRGAVCLYLLQGALDYLIKNYWNQSQAHRWESRAQAEAYDILWLAHGRVFMGGGR